jgi:hypothetical protein
LRRQKPEIPIRASGHVNRGALELTLLDDPRTLRGPIPNRTHLVTVARKLKQQLNGKAFLTIPRTDITELLREVSGEPATRIKSGLAADLTSALINQGVQVYPSLEETTTGDMVRLYHAGSLLGQLMVRWS